MGVHVGGVLGVGALFVGGAPVGGALGVGGALTGRLGGVICDIPYVCLSLCLFQHGLVLLQALGLYQHDQVLRLLVVGLILV